MIETITPQIYQHVLTKQELDVHFQPIVSISKRKMIGFESLLRTYYHGEFISPDSLFSYAKEQESVHILDNICQTYALKRYQEGEHNNLIFVNLETSLLDYYLKHAETIMKTLDEMGIPRGKVVLEINEKRAHKDSSLVSLVGVYRAGGFLIALDDVGAGHSNLNRIVLAKPDIVKIDRSVIMNIQHDYYKQEVLRSITELGQKIGAITIAEGVEEEQEVITCVECGVDWFQGYYFSKAIESSLVKQLSFQEKCQFISESFQEKAIAKMRSLSSLIKKRKQSFQKLVDLVVENYFQNPQASITSFLENTEDFECVYLINQEGKQITDTIFHPKTNFRNQDMFSPMGKGDFHISKLFYNYAWHNKEKIYVSVKYISLATGNYCQTLSKSVYLSKDCEIIVCADFNM